MTTKNRKASPLAELAAAGRPVAPVDIRRALGRTQVELAPAMGTRQADLSAMERRPMRLGTLQRYVAALGGELRLVAEFDGVTVELAIPGTE